MSKIAIPTGADELAEMLADDKVRAQVFATPDTAQEYIAAYISATSEKVGKDLDAKIAAGMMDFLKANGVQNRPDLSALSGMRPQPGSGALRNAAYNPEAPGAKADSLGFKGLGDFAKAIWHRNRTPDEAKLAALHEITNAAYSSSEPSGAGFLIPEEVRAEIMQLALEQSIVRPRATVITMGSKTTSIPAVDVTTHAGSVFGGMVFYWTPESGEILTSQAKFMRVGLEARKLTGGAGIPNELFADAPALGSWLQVAAPMGLAFFEDLAFFTGDGGNEPLGWLEGGGLITVAKESGQAAGSVVSENIFKMYSRMLPQSLGSAVWTCSPDVLPQLLGLTIAVGTGGSAISVVNLNATPVPTILGRPLIVTEKVPSVGNAGDLSFVDLSYYLIGDRQSVSMETSEHARFMNDETMLKIIERVDGRPWIQSALTPANGGATLSPFVTLGARA